MSKQLSFMGLFIGLLALAGVAINPIAQAQEFDTGKQAYNRKDYDTALKEWLPLAEQGHTNAQNFLGLMYDRGQGVKQDYQTALAWYRRAAERGHTIGQMNVADMYWRGRGVDQSYQNALIWYFIASAGGSESAIDFRDRMKEYLSRSEIKTAQRIAKYCLGSNYTYCSVAEVQKAFNKGQEAYEREDYANAAKSYRIASEQGVAEAQFSLGLMYAEGRGVIQNYQTAHLWLNIASTNGNEEAKENRDFVAENLSADQINTAQRFAQQCIDSNYTDCP